jgi:hypothetical protein
MAVGNITTTTAANFIPEMNDQVSGSRNAKNEIFDNDLQSTLTS